MTDLDKQAAEAQGFIPTGDGWLTRNGILHCDKYHPSTNLNQAATFAENTVDDWRITTLVDGGYRAATVKNGKAYEATSSHHAEALCLAVLKALGERSV